MKHRFQDIIGYYRACYIHDFKAVSVPNFFAKAVEYRYVLKSFEPLSGRLKAYPVNSEWGAELEAALTLHSKEKALYVGAFFLKGKMQVISRATSIFAPLFLFDAHLSLEDDVYYVEVDVDNPTLNPAFLDYVKSNDSTVTCTFDELSKKMPKGKFNFDNLIALKNGLAALFPNWNVDSIDELIQSDAISVDLNGIQKSRSKSYERVLLSGAAIGLVKKPKGARGVINELTTLSQKKISSNLFKALFSEVVQSPKSIKKRGINVPVSLSESQKKVFYSVDNQDVTMVVGPPGTGKSFTIAALATELMSKQRSVLIASKNNQAGHVIGEKIKQDFGLDGLVIETYERGFKNALLRRVNRILQGIAAKHLKDEKMMGEHAIVAMRKEIDQWTALLLKREKEELKWGRFFHEYRNTFFQKYQSKWVEYKYRKRIPIWQIKQNIDQAERKKNRLIKKYIIDKYNAHLQASLVSKRSEFLQLVKALGQQSGSLMQEGFENIDFGLILKALPAWICNATDVHRVLPLKEGLFDVVIIDEATQCDIASMIPLMYRAKKVVIVGDPKQLRHISFLSSYQDGELRKKFKITDDIPDYRTSSILDLVNAKIHSQNQVVFLDEHYRSMPDIVSFSNKEFYDGGLNVMTETPVTLTEKNLFLRRVMGQRSPSGKNNVEAQAIVDDVAQIIENQHGVAKNIVESIGIISPFRAQVTLIKTLLRQTIPLKYMKKHRILVGTPFHFQGEERDVVFLSFVVDDKTHHSTHTYLNREDVFNVSITRARNRQLVFTSIQALDQNPNNLLTKYLSHMDLELDLSAGDDVHDEFAQEIVELLQSWGISQIFKSFPVAGVDIDIVAVHNGKTHCIDLIGYPGLFEAQFTPAKIRRLARMNHDVFFLPYSSWYLEKEVVMKGLKTFIGMKK